MWDCLFRSSECETERRWAQPRDVFFVGPSKLARQRQPAITHVCSTDVCIWTLIASSPHKTSFFFPNQSVAFSLPFFLYIPLVLSISLSTCSASASQWLSEEEFHPFGNLPSAMIWWVREQINSRNINRIFTSFHRPLVTGYSHLLTSRLSALTEGSPLRPSSWEQEIGRLRSTCFASQPLLPLSPETTPVALCWQLTGCRERAQPTSGNEQ